MAYDTEDQAPPHPADPPQPLADFVGSFTDPTAQGVFRDAAIKVQDYLVRRQIADENTAAADRLFANLGRFRDGMVGMVQGDPAATHLGLSIVPDIVQGIVGSHPYLADEQREPTATELTTGMQQEIARAGVMAYADRDETAARRLLDQPHVASLFDESGHRDLNGYIGAMATARSFDAAALAQQRAADDLVTREMSATKYMGALVDPNTQELQFPPGWAQHVTADPTLPPGYTAQMLGIYDRLQKGGDAPASDPFIMADFINMAANGAAMEKPTVGSALQYAGTSLKLIDALSLANMALPTSPLARDEIMSLDTTIQAFKRQVMTPENGPAGVAAFARFMDYLIPAYRTGGPGSLEPGAQNSVFPRDEIAANRFWESFAPRADDLVVGGRQTGLGGRMIEEGARQDRPSLDAIFGGRRRSSKGDQVIRSPRARPVRMPTRETPIEPTFSE